LPLGWNHWCVKRRPVNTGKTEDIADMVIHSACGPTHTSVAPLDLVKCRRQVDPRIYSSNITAWRTIYAKEGLRGVFFGWSPTFVGYCFQGAGKYGFYEMFKYQYGEKLFPNLNKTVVFLGASASAEFIADLLLCPFEAIKVRMQTTLPPFASTLREGWSKIVAKEGYGGLYKGLYPLWGRQIPYTMGRPTILVLFPTKEWADSNSQSSLRHLRRQLHTSTTRWANRRRAIMVCSRLASRSWQDTLRALAVR